MDSEGKARRWTVLIPRVIIIIDFPQKDLFHNRCDIIILSQMAVSDLVDSDKFLNTFKY